MQKFQNYIAKRAWTGVAIASLLCAVSETTVHANGINGNGTGAASMAMGGTDVAWAHSPLEAMGDNPAGLGFLDSDEFDIGGVGASANGTFNKPSAHSSGNLNETPEALPEGALGMRLGNSPFSAGISFIPQSMLLAEWHYPDPPSGPPNPHVDQSYGYQEDKSEILVLRTAAGLAMQLTPQLSVGVTVGAVYNKNQLVTPYIFQNVSGPAAGLDGYKTLLDLNTSGFGANGQIGIMYRPLTNLQFGLSYQTKYRVNTSGDANGEYGGTLPFHYDAQVVNTFPDEVELGGSWKFLPKWRLAAEVDWIDWKNSFSALPVRLSNGSGPLVTALGTTFENYSDSIPLDWRSEFVYRVGLEYALTDNLFLRGGYCYGNDPVPSTTLSPMTAAIMQNTITCGIGYRWRACEFDAAYQCDLPVNHHVGTSDLLDGEYSNSSTEVQVNWFALTMRVNF